jgi:hypothetical protein
LVDQSDPIDYYSKGRKENREGVGTVTVLRMAEPELPTSSDSTSASNPTTSATGNVEQAGNEAGPSQVATGSGTVATASEGSGDGGVAGTSQQGDEDMSVQVDATGAGNDQSEDMVIEAGPSHIGKRVKVRLSHMTDSVRNGC